LVSSAYERTKSLLRGKKEELETLAKELLEKEILFQSDLENLIGKRPFAKETTYEAYTKKADKKDTIIAKVEENGNGKADHGDTKEPLKVEESED